MVDNSIIHSDDYSKVTITNDYPCLVGGNWIATVQDGQTVITDGNNTYTGPVNLIGASLTINSDAIVDGIIAIPNNSSGSTPSTLTVNSGGKLQNSTIFNSNVSVAGISEGNTYVSARVTINSGNRSSGAAGGESDSDSFYNPLSTSNSAGQLDLSQGAENSAPESFQISNAGSKLTLQNPSQNIRVNNPYIDSSATTNSKDDIYLGYNTSFGSVNVAKALGNVAYNTNNAFTLTNDLPVYQGGNWTASLGEDGVTYYTDGKQTVTGPFNLVGAGNLKINAGAVVDGITITGATTTITNDGTLKNSFVANGYIVNNSGGLTENNTFLSEYYTGNAGSTTKGDYFYEAGKGINGLYNLSQAPNLRTFAMSDNKSPAIFYEGSIFDGSYFGTGPNGYFHITEYDGSNVSCFLAGTLIETVSGGRPVEQLTVGDEVIVYKDRVKTHRKVVWTGYNHVKVNSNVFSDITNYPIRILKNAIADNVPFKDLLVTSEHCLFIEDKFIPVRMLVNNSTIFYDKTITEYTYYHFETDDHSIVVADGALTESYLDTGNRSNFISDTNVISIVNKNKRWGQDSAAPLVTAREIVEPLYRKFTKRSEEIGYKADLYSKIITTNDYGLYLLTNDGKAIYPSHQQKDRFVFKIPSKVTKVRLISNTSQPSTVVGPFVDDRRHLGVLIGDITMLETNQYYRITDHVANKNLKGWDVQERSACRWTNGNAELNIRSKPSARLGILVIRILAGGPYVLPHQERMQQKVG
ncbi:Hint domain-containing protein [Commensalibacter oyaizuii]|uniref:Hint domain-containing protein n=1 Tax=Commensalibacter oyaizuii TaxID=3043873 RepID=A0ABT6Q2K6_9PROT|nr:Hint domain-containing protein [Commensalibacter sp. TBRC 16381]MDI2091328.1 Hint domain-containing protein [Commensalibacter sp. TBRC 16381]